MRWKAEPVASIMHDVRPSDRKTTANLWAPWKKPGFILLFVTRV